jgi:hypothetical protein
MRQLQDGDPEFDCKAILDALYAPERGDVSPIERIYRWSMLWQDLQHRTRGLDVGLRKRMLQAALRSQLPLDLRPADWHDQLTELADPAERRLAADIVILCIIEEEFNATLVAFGINQRTQPDTSCLFGHRFYKQVIETKYCDRLNVWIGLVG